MSRIATRLALLAVLLFSAGVARAQLPDGTKGSPRALDEVELTRYIATLRELVKLGDELGTGLAPDPSGDASLATGMAYSEKMRTAIESRGFTPESFADVHWNTMMAYMAIELEGQQAELEKAREEQQAALEAMKEQLSPEQFEQLKKSMAGAQSVFDAYEQVPPGNVALVKKHRAEIAAIVGR